MCGVIKTKFELNISTFHFPNSTLKIQTVQKVVFFYVKPYCAALERRGKFSFRRKLGAFSAKMPLFQKQSAGLFLKFTPKRAGVCLRQTQGRWSRLPARSVLLPSATSAPGRPHPHTPASLLKRLDRKLICWFLHSLHCTLHIDYSIVH